MYLNNHYVYDNNPYGQTTSFHSTPFTNDHFYHDAFDVRQFGPGFPSQGGPMGPPPGQGSQAGAPTAPPPSFVPAQTQQASTFAVDPGSIRGCLFRYTYIWLRNRQQFWFFPTFVGRTSISGWRWNGFRWIFFGVSLREIQSFTCV